MSGCISHAKIPLVNRRGETLAYTTVDVDDFPSLSAHRWLLGTRGYAYRYTYIQGRQTPVFMHREITGLPVRRENGPVADHINGDVLDNRRANLRIALAAENLQNRRLHKNNTSSFRGVSWRSDKGLWRAFARLNGRHIHIGYFRDPVDAANAASRWRSQHMPFSIEADA